MATPREGSEDQAAKKPIASPSIRRGDGDRIAGYVRQALDLFADGKGTTLEGVNIQRFAQIVYILSDRVSIGTLKSNSELKRALIGSSIRKLKAGGIEATLDNFFQALSAEHEANVTKPPKKYVVVLPVNLDFNSLGDSSVWEIRGSRLEVCSLATVSKKVKFDTALKWIEVADPPWPAHRSSSYFVIEKHASGWYAAAEAAWADFRLLRAILNYAREGWSIRYHFGKPAPWSTVRPPRFMFVFDEGGNLLEHGETDEHHDRSVVALKSREKASFEMFLKRMNELQGNSLQDTLASALVTYGAALDETDPAYVFLGLWTVLELLALKRYGLPESDVCKRMASLSLPDHRERMKDTLSAILTKRNSLVHDGAFHEFSEEDVNELKPIVDQVVRFILEHAPALKEKRGLENLYENINLNETEIARKEEVLGLIKKLKLDDEPATK